MESYLGEGRWGRLLWRGRAAATSWLGEKTVSLCLAEERRSCVWGLREEKKIGKKPGGGGLSGWFRRERGVLWFSFGKREGEGGDCLGEIALGLCFFFVTLIFSFKKLLLFVNFSPLFMYVVTCNIPISEIKQ